MCGCNQKIIPGELLLEKRTNPGSAESLWILMALVRYADKSKLECRIIARKTLVESMLSCIVRVNHTG